MKKRLSETNVLTLPTRRKAYQAWDEGGDSAKGLSVLVSPGGVRTYRATFYFPGSTKAIAMKLGRVGEMGLEEAREKTREVRGIARQGRDPRKTDPVRSLDFKSSVETWTTKEQIGNKKNKSANETQSMVLYACRDWWQRPVATIMKHEVIDLLETKREYAPYASNRLHAHLKTFFKWCAWTDRIQVNPMAEMPKPFSGGKSRDREWFRKGAADEVIRALWKCADELGGDDAKFVKLLLITGKRKNAILKMDWAQIDSEWFWTPVPGSRTKRNHPIPLPALAQRVLGRKQKEGRILRVKDDDLVKVVREKIKLPDFFWHGIRHIAETKAAELKIPPHIRDMLYDHAPMRGAGKGYDHHDYMDEMSAAQKVWCNRIEALVTPAGVRRLR